ncbi:MAG TPA: DUF6599 family protein [Thermoanaerobaculia bacterium]|nr:DUF6599 family protein [Thermoanaerobaculia bacterium]
MAVALLIVLAAACEGRRAALTQTTPRPTEEISFASIDSPSLLFLPRRDEVPGWRLESDPIVIPASRLQTYLERDSAHFLRYGVLDLTVGTYTQDGGPGFATVEIFRFPDYVKAFGAYSLRKQGAVQFLEVANEAFRQPHSIHVWRGAFYIRAIGAAPDDALLRLVSAVADRMPQAPSKPAVFGFLPDGGRLPNSERYSAESGFGQPYLGNSFQASFNINGDVIDGLVIPAESSQAAAQILNQYRALFVRNGKLLDPVPNLGEDNFTAEDKYLGRAVAFRIDRFVVAFNGYGDRQDLVNLANGADQKILGTIRRQLVNAEKTPAQ